MGLHVVVDLSKCSGCRYCEVWCSFTHEKVFSTSFSRIRVIKDDVIGMDSPIVCQQCVQAVCVSVCPTGALYVGSDGVVRLERMKCVRCGKCLDACPYGAVFKDPVNGFPLICDLCGGRAVCVMKCPTNALSLYPLTEVEVVGVEGLGRRYELALTEFGKLLERWGVRVRVK
jgi:carbon-monoxide dehydrogenase iron sulfur subunit